MSHPAWVCGLKHHWSTSLSHRSSHTLRGCVDWNVLPLREPCRILVTPCVGVWIETSTWPLTDRMLKRSHPAWVCGLKHVCLAYFGCQIGSHPAWVCGLKRRLIEIFTDKGESHPAWVCGLKPSSGTTGGWSLCHTLRGCVDWNQQLGVSVMGRSGHTLRGCVDWNSDSNIDTLAVDSHTLRGCVDWNSWCDTVSVIWRSHTLRGCVDWNKNGLTTTIL